jgi:SAM-dependent methyltransferase
MTMENETDFVATERQRILAMYQQREEAKVGKRPWESAAVFKDCEKRLNAAVMLHAAGVFPKPGDQCLEVGFGTLGWLGELINWGVRETDLHGIELHPGRVEQARQILPLADLQIGEATKLPWESNTFALVVVSTVFSSILDARVCGLVAKEITRVLKPGGALLWYDAAFDPRGPGRRRIGRKELLQHFPNLHGRIRSVTLLPPLARFLVPKSWTLATCLAALPFLRSHLLAVLLKQQCGRQEV